MNTTDTHGPVVGLSRPLPGVGEIRMRDATTRNGFSRALCSQMRIAFAEVEADPDLRVVVLIGDGSYFSSGDTRDADTPDGNICSIALDCSLPVVAAMQGHATGAGFALGLFADISVLAREAVYGTSFLRYGFMPSMGTTLALSHKLGSALAAEMLLAADSVRGATLQARGVAFPVVARANVREHALSLARALAEKPRHALQLLKRHMVADLRKQLPEALAAEEELQAEAMLDAGVRDRIAAQFGDIKPLRMARSDTVPMPSITLPPGYRMQSGPGTPAEYFSLMEAVGWPGWDAARLRPWQERVLDGGWCCIVDSGSGRLVASGMALRDDGEFGVAGGEIGWIGVVPECRGMGLGFAVSAAVTACCFAAGYDRVHLYIEDWRLAALRTYLRLGYEPLIYAPDMIARWRRIRTMLGQRCGADEGRRLTVDD